MHPATSISDIQWKEEQVSTVQGYILLSIIISLSNGKTHLNLFFSKAIFSQIILESCFYSVFPRQIKFATSYSQTYTTIQFTTFV